MKVLAVSGSLRSESYNTKLLRAAAELLPAGVELELWQGLKAVPPYDEEDDVEPAPAPVVALRTATTCDFEASSSLARPASVRTA